MIRACEWYKKASMSERDWRAVCPWTVEERRARILRCNYIEGEFAPHHRAAVENLMTQLFIQAAFDGRFGVFAFDFEYCVDRYLENEEARDWSKDSVWPGHHFKDDLDVFALLEGFRAEVWDASI